MAKTLSDKFFIKPNQHIAMINAPEGYLKNTLTTLPEMVLVTETLEGTFDQIQGFITTRQQVTELVPMLKDHLKEGGVLWLCYPKGGPKASVKTDLNRDSLVAVVSEFGLEPNHQIAIDETWSALRVKALP